MHTVDETGFGVGLAVSAPEPWHGDYPGVNRTGAETRWNQPLQHPGRVRPIRVCHVAVNIPKAGQERAAAFYTERLGFVPSERVRDVGVFLRAPGDTDHHTLLLGHRADRAGVNHLAYEVATVDEVIVGANDMIDRGWQEARHLGRHTIGSNFFRFIHAPCGGRVEFASDMDRVDDSYGPRDHEETPPHTIFALKSSREPK
jgi:catechol 2,3-dioxygenase-like lactoylglutathione lyase family enzyme